MKTGNKNNWMVWALVVLVVMNIAAITTILYNRAHADSEEAIVNENMPLPENTSPRYSGRYFRDQLNFSGEQMARFAEFNPVFRENARSINNDLNQIRQEMLTEMASQNCDTVRLNALSDSIGSLHANLKKLTCRYYLDIRNICDQQQKEKLEQLFSGMFAGDFQQGRYGKGNQHGRQHGRQ